MSDNAAAASVPRKFAADAGAREEVEVGHRRVVNNEEDEEQGQEARMDDPEAEDGDLADPGSARAPPNSTLSTSRAGIRMVSPPPGHARGIVMPAREVLAGISRAGMLEHRVRRREASMVSGLDCESGKERGQSDVGIRGGLCGLCLGFPRASAHEATHGRQSQALVSR